MKTNPISNGMKKQALIVLLAFLLLWGVSFIYDSYRPFSPTELKEKPLETFTVSYATTTLSEKNPEEKYSINFEYPIFSVKEDNRYAGYINGLVEKKVKDAKESFLDNVEEINNYTSNVSFEGGEHTLLGNTEVILWEEPLITSLLFKEEFNMIGAAHPGHTFESLIYDLKDQKILMLEDLFSDPMAALSYISPYAKKQLEEKLKQFDAEGSVIEAGLIPEEENFKTFTISEKGMRIVFQEYQVAAYAAGVQEVLIPWDEIIVFLKNDIRTRLGL